MFHSHLQSILLREMFQRNSYPENFLDKCFKLFLNRIHTLKEKVPTVEEKLLRFVLPYFGTLTLQTKTKLQKSIKVVLNCCTLHVIFKVKTRSVTIFVLKNLFPMFLHQAWCNFFSVDYAMNPIA